MYYELGSFAKQVLRQKSFWKDGELWTAVLTGMAAYIWFCRDPVIIEKVRAHFGDLLNATSIVFGFALAALSFYIQAAAGWRKEKRVARVAQNIVDWHIWTIICMLSLIGYLLGLWAFGVYLDNRSNLAFVLYAVLAFQIVYCGSQILNHTLTIGWSFRNRDRLNSGPKRATKTLSCVGTNYLSHRRGRVRRSEGETDV